MAKSKTNLLTWVLVGVGLALVGNAIAKPTTPAPPSNGNNNTPNPLPLVNDFPIVYMKFSEAAKPIQIALGFTDRDVDGKIGPKTLAALKMYLPSFTERFKISNQSELQSVLNQIK
jgi:hypothetical protein